MSEIREQELAIEEIVKAMRSMRPLGEVAKLYVAYVVSRTSKIEAADILGVDRRSIQRWMNKGDVPFGKGAKSRAENLKARAEKLEAREETARVG